MARMSSSKGMLPNLSLRETRHKADQYSLSDLHRQTNTAAKQAILHELHSSMQLRAERMRLHRKGTSETYSRDDAGIDSTPQTIPTSTALNGNTAKHVTFHEPELEPRSRSRIPVPVRPDRTQRPRDQQAGGAQARTERSIRKLTKGGDGDGRQHKNVISEYTWGLRGRLNEIRIRFLARKFFKLWRKNAFAKVKPSVIRRHYNSRLLKKMFDEWKGFWWTQRREWTLMIRAEYHHRYKIYQHVWVSWRAFVVKEKVKNAKKEISSLHASSVRLSKAITAWKQYILQRRAKAALYQRAKRYRQRHTLLVCWNQWRAAVQWRMEEQDAEMFALQYWADGLTRRAWDAWKRRCREKQEMKGKERQAQQFYEQKLMARCLFLGLKTYARHRLEKKRINAHASKMHADRLLKYAWQHWNQRWFTRRSLAQRQEQVDCLGNRARMRRVIINWRFYVDIHLVHVERRKEDIAMGHRNTQLKKLGFLILRLAVVQRRVKERRIAQALELYQQMLVKRCWNQWMHQCEHREELRLFSATRKARQMHRKRTLTEVIHHLRNYAIWRRHRKEQYSRADVHYVRRNLLPKCIQGLRHNAELEKRKRALQEQAAEFYREGQLGRCFYRWCSSFQTSQDVRMMERMAFLHHESVLARRFFVEWREKTNLKLQESEKTYIAVGHYHTTLCTRALARWTEFTTEARQRSEFERLAAQHAYMQTTRKALDKWREYVSYRRHKAVKRTRADFYYCRKQMRIVFISWKQHCHKMRDTYQVVAVEEATVNHRRIRYAFHEWRHHVEAVKHDRSLERRAFDHWNTRKLHKVFTAWHIYAQQHAAQTAVKSWRLEQLQTQLNKGKLERAFKAWKQCTKSEAEERKREMRADAFHAEKLRKRCFRQWKAYRLLGIKKALIARQAMWLNKIRMQAKYFTRWKHQFGEAQQENRKTVMALWLWSMRLQQRTLHAWISYVKERQRKKARIAAALEARRLELLKEGVRQWFMVAAALGERRAAVAAKHHAQTSYKSYQVVQRCATRWRQRTIANRGKKKPQTQRKVRFEDEHSARGHGSKVTVPIPTQKSSMVLEPFGSRGIPVISSSSVDGRMSARQKEGSAFSLTSKPVTGKVRPQPRRPDFLRDSLQREGLWSQSISQREKPEDKLEYSTTQNVRIPQTLSAPNSHTTQNSKWTNQSNESAPTSATMPTAKNVPLDDVGRTQSSGNEGQSWISITPSMYLESSSQRPERQPVLPRTASLELGSVSRNHQQHTTGHSNFDLESDSESEKHDEDAAVAELGEGSTKCDKGHRKTITVEQDSRNESWVARSRDMIPRLDAKPPVLLPPSAFSSTIPSRSRMSSQGSEASQSSLGGSDLSSWNPASQIPPSVQKMRSRDDREQKRQEKGRAESPEILVAEIQRLKNTLQGYQDMKTKLKRLRSQEAELQGWVKELNLPSSTEDSAALLIGDELTQVQEEILLLSNQLQERKPDIKNVLSQITCLTQQTTQ